MSKRSKAVACLAFVLAIVFFEFFQFSKHEPALSQVNPFADDPYDAVGSFGVQLAEFTGLIALIRAFRPYASEKPLEGQELLFARSVYFCCLSVLVTLAAYAVALLRHPSMWVSFSAGYMLVALTGGLALFALLVIWLMYRSIRGLRLPATGRLWMRAVGVVVVGILLLAVFPEDWRNSVHGELLTVFVGIFYLYALVWAIGTAICPAPGTFFEDVIDDLAAVYGWLKASVFRVFLSLFEKVFRLSFIQRLLDWLNPRKHTWNFPLVMGILLGIWLALAEVFGEGVGPHEAGRFILITAIFIVLECAGILLGYLILAKPLGLFRRIA